MSEQPSISKKSEMNPRTARAVAAILSQTRADEALRGLNQSDGRNQSEQASFLAAESPFLREIYERGGTVVDGVLTVPKENLSASAEIEIATTPAAVERLTKITNDVVKAKELAPRLVEMGERIAGTNADGETRLKVFGWLYRTLEGKQELLQPDTTEKPEREQPSQSEAQFTEKWQQIVELSEAMAALEPKDRLPENSLEALGENLQETETAVEQDENLTATEIYENAVEAESAERVEGIVTGGSLVGFERIEIGSDLPKIPENLSRTDFEKLLEKAADIDLQLERGVFTSEILAPFKRYVETTRLDNELRLVEEEYVKGQTKIIGSESGTQQNYSFVAGREELREMDEDRALLDVLREQKTRLTENIQTSFDGSVNRAKVGQSIDSRNYTLALNNQIDSTKTQNIELTEDEAELRQMLVKEKSVGREIDELSESINEREKGFRAIAELSGEQISAVKRKELIEKVVSLELPVSSVLKEKYPELTARERSEKLTDSNTFEIQSPAEYLFVREAADKQFQILRTREIKKQYRQFENVKLAEKTDANAARRAGDEHQEKVRELRTIEPVFAYKIEGSKRIINAKPSERAVAGYEFTADYVRYQLKQPEMRMRHESSVYRDYATRLEAAKTSHDVVRESFKIRQENHRAAGVWKNAKMEEQRKLQRPLSKNEMTLLFLEQPPKSYTAEMSVLKYNFAHYTEAKTRMTAALAEGNLKPGAEAEKLVESLEGRLIRRDLETKHKATKHFFESLKIENEKLVIKNEFDHRAAYQSLPPHEKDWIYSRASHQKENLEYKIAYNLEKNAEVREVQPQNQTVTTNEAGANLRQEFAIGTLWHQAALLTSQKEMKNFERGAAHLDEKLLQTVGFLVHNQSEANNLRLADWLEKQKPEELKTAGEILKTFAGATREIENNRLTITVKIAETNRISNADYQNLFERYFPTDFEKLKEFRADDNEKFRLEQSRRDGQAALLNDWEKDAQTAIYRENAPVSVFKNERRGIEEIEKIKAAQIECRRANEIKNAITLKYEGKLKQEFAKTNQKVSDGDLRAAIGRAFAPEKTLTLTREQKAVFEKAQDKISLPDFKRFSENSNRLEKGINEINQSFETIAALRLENAQYQVIPEKTKKIESLQKQYETTQQQAEAAQITAVARERYAEKTIDDSNAPMLARYVTSEDRQQARIESHRRARIALEPAELNEPQHSSEFQAKALEFADALENAHQAILRKQSESEIADAFTAAEMKREQFREFLKIENESQLLRENKPVTLLIYERELTRNERAITQAKIARMIETGKLSLADLETKKAGEILSPKERAKIKLEAGERTRENLEPKELWARHGDVSEKLQQAALGASEILERAHEIYHEAGADRAKVARAFFALDAGIITLKSERRMTRAAAKFINFKTDFKRDLAQMFERGQSIENPRMLAAMTKGLLIDGLEKQNIQPEKIGIGGEKLSEISMTITLAMTGDKKREPFAGKNFDVNRKSQTGEFAKNENFAHRQTEQEKQHVQAKPKQFERAR